MKKGTLFYSVFSIIVAGACFLSLFLTADKGRAYWIGFGFFLLSCAIAGTLIWVTGKQKASPLTISVVVLACLYVTAALVINILFGRVFPLGYPTVLCIHMGCLVVFSAVLLLMLAANKRTAIQSDRTDSALFESQILCYEFEKVKIKLAGLPPVSRNSAMKLIDGLLEEIRFSDFSQKACIMEMEDQIIESAGILLAEADNLVQIQAEDISGFAASVDEAKQLIQNRNLQIKLLKYEL